jgi:hypothetical protein
MISLHDIWVVIGSPSWISGVLLPGAIGLLAKYVISRVGAFYELENQMKLLKLQLENLDRLLSQRIDDIKK